MLFIVALILEEICWCHLVLLHHFLVFFIYYINLCLHSVVVVTQS